MKIGCFTLSGELISKWEIPTRTAGQGSLVLPDIAESIEKKLSEEGESPDTVSGIGVAVPGPVINHSFVKRAVNLGWENLDVRETLRELTGVKNIAVENDAKTAALGEWWKGGHENCSSAVLITIGTGIGGGVIMDGKIINGAFGAAGELSHIQVDPEETEACACGKFGHLQQYASAEGIVREFRKNLTQSGKTSVLSGKPALTAKDIFDAAKAGDEAALTAVRNAARMIARVMGAVSAVIDPELFLIGGGVAKAGDFLLDMIREEFRRVVIFTSEDAAIEPAVLGNDAGICGAVKLVL